MPIVSTNKLGRAGPGEPRRRPVSVSTLVELHMLAPNSRLPLVVEPAVSGVDIIRWLEHNLDFVDTHLPKHGAILFRGFDVSSVAGFEGGIRAVSGKLLEYTYGSTPRTRVSGAIYTSTEYPADQHIPLHNEMAYARDWPMKIWFYCLQPARSGGATPIADSRRVFERIDPTIRDTFSEKKILYVRNYGHGVDVPWFDVFQTHDKSEVERQCRRMEVEIEWLDDDRLRTRQVCQAVARHPQTGENVWFNQAHLFHISNLEAGARESLLANFAEEDLPRNAFYGDGTPIEPDVLEHIREIYRQETVSFPWQERDIMLLDNMLSAHGRTPFEGTRKVVVGMAEPCR
jgi:alpha-ketoglutarate-dependent taurine dioxygenase